MPDTGSRPRPATVEDWDDDAQTTLSSTRATANVAVKRAQSGLVAEKLNSKPHDGSDSGYSSRAPTVGSTSTGFSKMSPLKVDTAIAERERKPYVVSAHGGAVRRESFTRPAAVREVSAPVVRDQPFVHPKGVCMTCDYYGQHIEIAPPTSAVQPPTPSSPKASKKSSNASRKEDDSMLKRTSTAPDTRRQFVQAPAVQPVYSASPNVNYTTWNTATTPAMYSYTTPTTATYVGPAGQASYFDAQPTHDVRPKPSRRLSGYGEAAAREQLRDEVKAKPKPPQEIKHSKSRSTDLKRRESYREPERRSYVPAAAVAAVPLYVRRKSIDEDYDVRGGKSIDADYDSRPSKSINDDYHTRPSKSINEDYDTRPSKSINDDYHTRPRKSIDDDYDRPYQSTKMPARVEQERLDRLKMPPPTSLPQRQPEITRRPSLRKSTTYNSDVTEHRRSRGYDYEEVDVRAVPPSPRKRDASPVKQRAPSPARPPSSYRPPVTETPSRPHPTRKSVSYSDPITASTTKVASSPAKKRTSSAKDPISSMEAKASAAEAYQAAQQPPSHREDLTLEKLQSLKKLNSHTKTRTVSSEKSEEGSAYSHPKSHQSSSRGSSGRGRSHTSAAKTSIVLDDGLKLEIPADYSKRSKGRPLSVDLGGGAMLIVGAKSSNKDKGKERERREDRMLEKPASVTSRTTRRDDSRTREVRSYETEPQREYRERSRSRERPRPPSAVESTSTSSMSRTTTNTSAKSSNANANGKSHERERSRERVRESNRRPPVTERGLRETNNASARARGSSVSKTTRRQSGGYSGGYGGW
jgi:hypothetical protein